MKKYLILLPLLIMILCSHALAVEKDFYTYNGFAPVTIAFKKIALIFSDSNYRGLFFAVCGIAMLLAAFSAGASIANGKRFSPLAWAIPMMIGITLYLALIVPKGKITVYDPAVNRFETIGNIPNGVVTLAGFFNLIERTLVKIIYTSSAPGYSYEFYAGGLGFNVLLKATGYSLELPDSYMEISLKRYINDCLYFEMKLPDSRVSVNQLKSRSVNFLDDFSLAQNPAIYTVFYDEDNRAGKTMTCTEAWTKINKYMTNPVHFAQMIKTTCSRSGFDTIWSNEINRCRETIRAYIEITSNLTGINETHFMRQSYIANVFAEVLKENSPELAARTAANRNTMSNGIATGIVANEWLPVIKAVITAVVIGMIPFLVLFIPTPAAGKASGIFAGFFIWLTSWGICDAVLHSIAMDLCVNAFERIRLNNLALVSMALYADDALKALGIFGLMRSFSLILATVITGMLVKFGGHALSTMSSNMMGTVRAQGAEAGALLTPEGHSSAVNKILDAGPTEAWYNKFGYDEIARRKMFQKSLETASGNEIIKGQGSLDNAVTMSAYAARQKNLEETSRYGQRMDNSSRLIGTQQGEQETARAGAVQDVSGRYFDSSKEMFNQVEKVKTAKEAGSASPHSIDTAYGTSRVSEEERIGRVQALQQASSSFGGVTAFAKAVSSKDLTKAGSVINEYAALKGISHEEAAVQMGQILGDKELVGVQGFEQAMDTVGRDQIAFAETNKMLNEAARFEQSYQFANTLGYAKSKEDFAGMYQAHQAHHAQESWTLMNQGAVDKLNAQMAAQGFNTRFSMGDRVTMARTQDGRITLAKASAGASKEQLDLTSSRTGYRGEHGSFIKEGNSHESYNQNVMHGYMQVDNPKTGEPEEVYGTFNFNPQSGELVSSRFSALQDGEMMTTFTGKDGRETTGVLNSSMDREGNLIYKFNAVNDHNVIKGNPGEEFVAHQSLNPNGNYVVFEQAKGGQDVGFFHQFKYHFDTGAEMSISSALVANENNLSHLPEWKRTTIMTGGALNKALSSGLTIGRFGNLFKKVTKLPQPVKPQKLVKVSRPKINLMK